MKVFKIKQSIKKAIVCKNVTSNFYRKDNIFTHIPKHGDVAIFQIKELGKHTRMQSEDGYNAFILPGDLIMAAFGNRYASDQFEGYIPAQPMKEYHMLGQGGAIGVVASMHQRLEPIGPTTLKLIGYVSTENGEVVNSAVWQDKKTTTMPTLNGAKVILSLGTSMDSGKTTTAGFLSHGLMNAGKKVAYIKLTGTVYTKDKRFVKDCGASFVIDFSDFGHPSTYLMEEEDLLLLYYALLQKSLEHKPDFIVVEIADGLFQKETSMLLKNEEFKKTISAIIFSATDSLNASMGVQHLCINKFNVIGVSGVLTISPLQVAETSAHVDVPILLSDDLMNKSIADRLTL